MFTNNPELTKNLKLEVSLTRFLIPVILLLLVAWAAWNSIDEPRWDKRPLEFYKGETLFGWMCGCGFFFTIIWGSYLAANSLQEEIKQKTWDFVRMSPISPAKILTGKLFGATAIVWTVTLLGIIPLLVFAGANMIPLDGVLRPQTTTLLVLAASVVCWTLLSYAGAILSGLAVGARNRGGTLLGSLPSIIVGLWIGGLLIAGFETFHRVYALHQDNSSYRFEGTLLPDGSGYIPKANMVSWYNHDFYNLDLMLIGLSFCAFWAIIGAYRALRKSLQHSDAPWCWLAFLISGAALLQGFSIDDTDMKNVLWGGILISMFTMAITCPNEAGDLIRYRLLGKHIQAGNLIDAFKTVPLWVLSFTLFIAVSVISIALNNSNTKVILFFISLLGFLIRDLFVLHSIAWSQSVRRPLLGIAIYLLCAYVLLPILANVVDKNLMQYLYPLNDKPATEGYWLLLAMQIAAAAPLFLKRWNEALGPKSRKAEAA